MKFSESIMDRAADTQKTLILPEATDSRILQAAIMILEKKLVSQLCLLGPQDQIQEQLRSYNYSASHAIEITDPEKDARREDFAHEYFHMRKHKGMTEEAAYAAMGKPLPFSSMMIRRGYYYALVAGAITTTADVLKSAIQIIGLERGKTRLSSSFLMELPDHSPLGNHYAHLQPACVFSDCAIIPKPSSEDLVQIALGAAETYRLYLEAEPRIAFLSFSTLGSAQHEAVERVQKSVHLIRELHPHLLVDGELQIDAALNPRVAAIKASHSPIAGAANTIIFPDLASGNIAYKTAQIFGSLSAYGPILQGLAAPVSDLSRGCTVQEIVSSAAMTIIKHSSLNST